MPLARYFLVVGAVLLVLLFISNAYLARSQVTAGADSKPFIIRIHSDRKWPERIVCDTSAPKIIPPQLASTEGSIVATPSLIDVPARAKERDAMAQLRPPDAIQLRPSASRMQESKQQRFRKVTKKRARPPALQVARQWRFGWFGNGVW